MSSADDIQAMLDDVYGVSGIPATWTPAGGAALPFTALELGGDEAGRLSHLVGDLNVSARILKARTSELAALAPGVRPLGGDAISTPAGSFLISGAPRQADPRRLEWTIEMADA